jgi:leucyl-tRNA synthetase
MVVGDEEIGNLANITNRAMTPDEERVLHGTIKKVTEDIEGIRLNTAISALMVFVNEFIGLEEKPRQAMEAFVVLLSPLAPHIAEEMWQKLGHEGTVAYQPWPQFDEAKIATNEVEIVLQVNSKIKGKMMMPVGTEPKVLEEAALAHNIVRELIEGKTIRKIIAVKDKLVNVIAG